MRPSSTTRPTTTPRKARVSTGKFIAEIEQALSRIVAFPEASSPVHERTRRKVLLGYPYSLMYSVTDSQIRILAVAHHSRRPFYWHGRD